jgi:hypothetical protein
LREREVLWTNPKHQRFHNKEEEEEEEEVAADI